MNFPEWVDDPKMSDEARASRRLKYMLSNVAARLCQRASMRALADHCGIDTSTLCYGIRKARLSDEVAIKLQDGAGKDEAGHYLLRFEDLKFPLRITTE